MKSYLAILVALVTVACGAPGRCSASAYGVVGLGTIDGFSATTTPWAINNSGQVVGEAVEQPGVSYRAFLYSGGVIQDIGTLGGPSSGARDINDSGQITGFAHVSSQPFLTQAFLYEAGTMATLGSLTANRNSHGIGINGLGQVVGDSSVVVNNDNEKHTFLYSGGTMHDLGDLDSPSSGQTTARDITNSGLIIGAYVLTGGPSSSHAFVYDGSFHDLGTLGGNRSSASAINEAGLIVGFADLPSGIRHAFLYDGTMHDLGSLGGNSSAGDINILGQVVGLATVNGENRAFLYTNGTMIDLNTLIDPASGWVLNSATAINDLGQIAGTGTFDGQQRAFLLTPVPEPSSVVMLLVGGGVASAYRRRRPRIRLNDRLVHPISIRRC